MRSIFAANMPPVEVGQDRGSRVGAQLGRELSIIQESDNSAAEAPRNRDSEQ